MEGMCRFTCQKIVSLFVKVISISFSWVGTCYFVFQTDLIIIPRVRFH